MSRRKSGRRTTVALCIVAIIAVLAMLTPASAAPSFVVTLPGATATGYTPPFVVVQRGQPLTYVNLDLPEHDVKSGTPAAPNGLFYGKVIGIGKKTPVVGVQNLPRGSYKFFCTRHTNMRGTLRVI